MWGSLNLIHESHKRNTDMRKTTEFGNNTFRDRMSLLTSHTARSRQHSPNSRFDPHRQDKEKLQSRLYSRQKRYELE